MMPHDHYTMLRTELYDPSLIVFGQTHLRLSRLVVESQPNSTNSARVPFAIHHIMPRHLLVEDHDSPLREPLGIAQTVVEGGA